jgi:hypothetical protein
VSVKWQASGKLTTRAYRDHETGGMVTVQFFFSDGELDKLANRAINTRKGRHQAGPVLAKVFREHAS